MKFKQPPLKINCDGLSKKLIADLADRLSLHFEDVKAWGDEISAESPLDSHHYNDAWRILDKFGVHAV